MFGNFFKNFYFFSKLTTTLVLFLIIVFFGYIFFKSYQNNNDNQYSLDIDEKINDLFIAIQNNAQALSKINNKIANNEQALNQVNQTLNNEILNSEFINLPSKFNDLLKRNENLNKEIINLSNSIKYSNNNPEEIEYLKKPNNSLENLINLIKLKYENGSNVTEELLLLQSQMHDELKNAYLEKLFVLSNKEFIGIQNLQNEFEILMKDYLKEYYIQKNNIFFYKYLSRFYSIEPNNNSVFKNETLKYFSIINDKLREKDIKSSLDYLLKIENSSNHFNRWIEEAGNYIDFYNNLNFINSS